MSDEFWRNVDEKAREAEADASLGGRILKWIVLIAIALFLMNSARNACHMGYEYEGGAERELEEPWRYGRP